MRLCTVQTPGLDPFFGVEIKTKILRVAAAAEAVRLRPAQRATLASMQTWLDHWPRSEKLLRGLLQLIAENPAAVAGKAADGEPILIPAKNATCLPPVPRPGKVLCVGWNYRDHCEEQNRPIPEFPVIFNKYPTSLIGQGAEIPLPLRVDKCIDYEAELAFVVGKRASRVGKRSAMGCVAGLMIMNDVSARTLQAKEKQWSRAKGFDGSGPCGPCLVTMDEAGDPHTLGIKCRVNGEVRQRSNTKHLIFKIPDLVNYITAAITLEPGDVVSTGTPGGVGVYREPPVFLAPGDKVEVEIERLGVLRNVCRKG